MTITLDGLLKDGRYQKLSTVSKALLPILLANLQEEGDRYELDREELAEQSGLADVAVRRALTELQNEGIIEQRKMVALTLGNGKPLPEGQKVRNKTSKTGKRLGRPPKGA
jgi:predicted ArsR family transcriptional regulator